MTSRADWVVTLSELLQQMSSADVTDLELRRGSLRVRLRRDPEAIAMSSTATRGGEGGSSESDKLQSVVAPLTGIYYAAANPTSRPFVAVGDWIEPDDVVGLIETMKVFNEVTADCRGRVAAILVQQGQLVHTGETLVKIDGTALPDHTVEVAS